MKNYTSYDKQWEISSTSLFWLSTNHGSSLQCADQAVLRMPCSNNVFLGVQDHHVSIACTHELDNGGEVLEEYEKSCAAGSVKQSAMPLEFCAE